MEGTTNAKAQRQQNEVCLLFLYIYTNGGG